MLSNDQCREITDRVKLAAKNQWPQILQNLAGLSELQTNTCTRNEGTSCPICGGNDRYSFKDPGDGVWGCRNSRCCPGGSEKGSGGDGWKMLMEINSWSFWEAVKAVAKYLGIEINRASQVDIAQYKKRAAEQKQAEEKRKLQEEQNRMVLQNKRADYARKEFSSGIPVKSDFKYLLKKKLETFDLREIQHPHYGRCLLIPMFNEQRELRNVQRIAENGEKRFIKNAQTIGCFYQLGKPTWTIYICEGWATGASIHISKPDWPCVLVSFSKNNMANVVPIARRLFPQSDLVIAADHDSAGIRAAVKVATEHNLKIVMPEQSGLDFSDLHVAED